MSIADLAHRQPTWHWALLAGLTLVSGLLPIHLPKVAVTISISETFVFAGTVLFGPSAGTVLVLLDALVLMARLAWGRRLRKEQLVFNLAAPPLSIWLAAHLAGLHPLFGSTASLGLSFVVSLAVFTVAYFLFNSWLITFAVALEQSANPLPIWWANFREVVFNYLAGASIAVLLVYNTRDVNVAFIAPIVPLLIIIYLTYSSLTSRVEAEQKKNAELNRVFLSTIEALAMAIDTKDQVTHGHIRRVQRYTMAVAERLGVKDESQLSALRAAALLHDTGKLAVPEYILNKPGPLTSSEFERMKLHAAVGADILKSIDFPYPVEPIVRYHHEAWDGSGYPDGLRGQTIPLGARILAVVDCYDALTSDRPYRPRMTRQEAEEVLRRRRGTFYDPWVVDQFLSMIDGLDEGEEDSFRTAPLAGGVSSNQLEVISATSAEEREFNELGRDLPKATCVRDAAEVLFTHLRRVIPAASLVLYVPTEGARVLTVALASGVGAAAIEALRVPLGERVSGWSFAHKQVVLNSDATLELGPVARTFSVPLRYAMLVPVIEGGEALAVIGAYASDPFDRDHRRLLETAATLFQPSLAPTASGIRPTGGSQTAATQRVH